jgi:ribose transport system substrate-binding protein
MKRLSSRLLLLAALAGLAFVFAACGDSSTSATGGGGNAASGITLVPKDAEFAAYQKLGNDAKYHKGLPCDTSPTPEEQVAYKVPKAKKRYRITLMEVTLAGYYYQAIAAGAKKAAQEAGVDLRIVSSGQGYADPATQIRQGDDVAQRGTDAVVAAPSDIEGSIPLVRKFVRAGTPFINISSEVATPDVYMVMQDDYEMGRISADQVAKQVGPEGGKGIVIAGPANATWSRKRAAGFADRVKEKYPNIEIVASPTQNVDPALGLKSFENAIGRDPDVKWVYTVFDFLLQPKALPASHKDVTLVSNGFDPVSAVDLKSGRIKALLGLAPTTMGYLGVGTAVAVLNGDKVPALQCVPIAQIEKSNMTSPVAELELIPKGFEE